MLAFWNKVTVWLADEEKGASMVEYALLVALIAIIAIVAVTAVGDAVSSNFGKISNSLNQ